MNNTRSGNVRVTKLKKEIAEKLVILAPGYGDPRIKRKIEEGRNFLEMIEKPPYNRCATVAKLKTMISDERNKLKARLVELDVNMPGHQFSLFETPREVSEQEQEEIARQQQLIEEEVKWLHKCLGMCSNTNYFK